MLASLLVIGLLIKDAELDKVMAALGEAHWGWFLAATVIKSVGVTLHEVRLYIALRERDPVPMMPVLGIGYLSGLMNVVLPIRGGDLIAVGLLRRELGVPTPRALAAVGITGFLEAAAFGVFLLGVLVFGAAHWEELLGETETLQATGTLTLVVLGSVFGSAVLVLLARRLQKREQPSGAGPLELVRQTLIATGSSLSSLGPLALNLGLAAIQVGTVVFAFWAVLPATGLDLEFGVLAACGIISMGAVAAIVLPPALVAGPTATAILVLGMFGVSEAEAIAYSALSWASNSMPPAILGLWPFLRRVGRLNELLRPEGEAQPPTEAAG